MAGRALRQRRRASRRARATGSRLPASKATTAAWRTRRASGSRTAQRDGGTAQWKGWDFNIFFQGVAHTSFFLSGTSIRSPFSSGNAERAAINSDVYGNVWMSTNSDEENASVIYPRLSAGSGGAGASNNTQDSTWWLRSGAFMRLKSLEIGYSLPKELLQKTFIKSLRFYLAGNNLLLFSPFKLWDPEVNENYSQGAGYPLNRTFSVGFTANF